MKRIITVCLVLFSFAFLGVSAGEVPTDTVIEWQCDEAQPDKPCSDTPADEKECLGTVDYVWMTVLRTGIVPQEIHCSPQTFLQRRRKPPRTSF